MPEIENLFWQAAGWVVVTVLSAVAGWFGGKYREIRTAKEKEDKRIDRLCDGMRSVLRSNLVDAYEKYVTHGCSLTIEDYENLQKSYEAYHGLEGNGVGTKMWDAIKRVPIAGYIREGEDD